MTVEILYSEIQDGIREIILIGRLDIFGSEKIETKFVGYCAGEKPLVVVDLSKVEFLASIGIRLLVLTAKSISSRGGKMVLLNPIPEVFHILELTGIPAIIPIYSQLESAKAVLMAS
jgi:anti-sigma B factor antagonist